MSSCSPVLGAQPGLIAVGEVIPNLVEIRQVKLFDHDAIRVRTWGVCRELRSERKDFFVCELACF